MRTLSANMTTQNDANNNKPVVEVTFDSITNIYCSGTFGNITGNHKKYLESFVLSYPNVSIISGGWFVNNPQVDFRIMDESLDVTTDLNSASFYNKKVSSKFGFQDIDLADFYSLQDTHIAGQISLENSFNSWNFTAKGIYEETEKDIFRVIPRRTLTAAYASTATSTISSTGDTIVDPTNLPSKIGQKFYVKIDNEIIGYTTVSSGNPAATITRGEFGTVDEDHSFGAEMLQFFAFPGIYPTDWLLYLMLTTDGGTGHAYYDLTSFDGAFTGFGLGLSSTEVDIEQIERIGYRWFFEHEACHYLGSYQTRTAKSWIVKNILTPANLFVSTTMQDPHLTTTNDNKFRVGIVSKHELYENTNTGVTITQDNTNKLSSFSIDMDSLINEIEVQYVVNPITGQHQKTHQIENDSSQTTHGTSKTKHVFWSPLINDIADSGSPDPDPKIINNTILHRLFFMFENPAVKAKIRVEPDKWLFEAYDTFTYTNTKMPDIVDGAIDLDTIFTVTGSSINYLGRNITYNLLSAQAYDLIGNSVFGSDFNFTVIEEGSITDTGVAYRNPADLVQHADNGNHTLGTNVSANFLYWDIKITPPNTGTTEHWISLRFKLFDVSPAQVGEEQDKTEILRYNSGDSTAFTVRIMSIANELGNSIPDNFASNVSFRSAYVQWYDASATGGSGERPTVEFVEFGYVLTSGTFSTV